MAASTKGKTGSTISKKDREAIGERIFSVREEAGLTLERMAKRVGVSTGAINSWENGHLVPSASSMIALAKKFEFSIDWLLLGV